MQTGIWQHDSSNYNTLTKNIISNNGVGIVIFDSDNNKLINNTLSSNKHGILIIGLDNLIYNNYFSNTNNAEDDGNNIWNIGKTEGANIIGGSYIGGNYWSDYSGVDTDGDGLGDTLVPYNSSGDIATGGDYHPLMKTWIPTPTPSPTPTPMVTPSSTPTPTTPPTVTPTPTPTSTSTPPTPDEEQPGFEAIFSIAGLLAVVYLIRRRK